MSKDYKKHAAVCRSYERTRKGHLVRTYRNMKSRVLGIQKAKAHLYVGLELMGKEEFYAFSTEDFNYNKIYDEWAASDYDRKMSPSIDRIDSSKGYTKGNIRWLTHSQNSSIGALSRFASPTSTTRYKRSA